MVNRLITIFLCLSWQMFPVLLQAQVVHFQVPVQLTDNVGHYEGLADSLVNAFQGIQGVDIAFVDDTEIPETVIWPGKTEITDFELFEDIEIVQVFDSLGVVIDTVFVIIPSLFWTPVDTTIQPDTVIATILVKNGNGTERKELKYYLKKPDKDKYDKFIDGVKQVGQDIPDAITDMKQMGGVNHPDLEKRKDKTKKEKIKEDKEKRDKEKE